jgi:effector-binding domain-containing protein
MRVHFVLAFSLVLPACVASRRAQPDPLTDMRPPAAPSSSSGASAPIEANWKERREQPYVFLERRGDYRDLGQSMDRLLAEVHSLGLRGDGAPFALFLDDPGKVALVELRSRVCLPIADRPAELGTLRYEVLPRAMVVYARVQGPHASVALAYPALFSYLRTLGWQPGGPVREVYLSGPERAAPGELVTEIQIPWIARSESTAD